MGWLIAAMPQPEAALAADGLINPVADRVQTEASVEPVAEDKVRDPFWPVGYSPVTKMVPVAIPPGGATASNAVPLAGDLMKKALTMLRIGGIVKRGTKYYATVNGTMVEAGDSLPVMVDGRVVLFNVRSIDMKRIRLEPARK